jgi:molybdopterin-containing oxidoreductase family membrane subunit
MLILSIAINIGMYTERFLIIATTLSRQYLPGSWRVYVPSLVEISIIVGSIAMFVTLFLLFVKVFPSVSIYEVKETMEVPKRKKGDTEWQAAH